MKKILLSLIFLSAFVIVKAQTVLNEIYTEPGSGKSEFFELYNTSGGSQNVNCYTILIYWKTSSTVRGWYVLDLPNATVASKGFFVGAAANPFNVQSQTGLTPNFNWNDINFRNGSTGGYLKKYQWKTDNSGYTDLALPNNTSVPDLFSDVSVGGGHSYIQLVYVNGFWSNTFWGGGSSSTLPSEITNMVGLPVDMAGSCLDFTATFNFPAEFVGQSPGSDNGFARKFDGKCGAWNKTSASLNHTPGAPNGSAAGSAGDLTISAVYTCPSAILQPTVITYNITGVTGAATEANSFPVKVICYREDNTLPGAIPGQLDGTDFPVDTLIDNLISDPAKSFNILPQNADVILVFATSQGCFDKVLPLPNSCASLPVNLKSFSAVRNNSNVNLKWETAQEENNKGFDVQRNIGGNWQSIGFIESKALYGNSNTPITYETTDINTINGITQYRLKQVDIDAKFSYSAIRSVHGLGQENKTIVYPNPSNDGRVNVVFEEVNVVRNVSLTDMSGRTIKQWKNVSNNTIQIESLTPGFYTLRIVNTSTGEQDVQKLIVNKR